MKEIEKKWGKKRRKKDNLGHALFFTTIILELPKVCLCGIIPIIQGKTWKCFSKLAVKILWTVARVLLCGRTEFMQN